MCTGDILVYDKRKAAPKEHRSTELSSVALTSRHQARGIPSRQANSGEGVQDSSVLCKAVPVIDYY